MRRIARILEPAFRAIVDRFDQEVPREEHVRFVERICRSRSLDAAINPLIADRLRAHACSVLQLEEPAALAREEHGYDVILDVAELPACEVEIGRLGVLLLAQGDSVGIRAAGWSVGEDVIRWEDQPEMARRRARQVLFASLVQSDACGVRTGLTGDVDAALKSLARGLPENRWFSRTRGAFYGSADLLRALIQHSGSEASDDELRGYTKRVLDLLTRHIEVRRLQALQFGCDQLPSDARPDLERLRFTIALLGGARVFADLRYLNTALKANDWHLARLRGRDAAVQRVDDHMLHYLAAVTEQEAGMQEAFL